MKWEVTITNNVVEKVEVINHKWADTAGRAENMVEGLLNSCWHVVKGKTIKIED